ncbi:MAG: creatininase family protein [Pseudomonadota bacterium]
MRLDRCTWPRIEAYLKRSDGILLPTGSTEQHGPIGWIGTDAICAETIAERAAARAGALVAPVLAYTPAPFNMAFAGTLSVSPETFRAQVTEILAGLYRHGFGHIYVLNGHGANLEPLREAASSLPDGTVRIRSWWDFESVSRLRDTYYGTWEGMHATPSEIAIVEALHGSDDHEEIAPPEPVSAEFIRAHAGDRHGPPDAHRARFPDGRVGSHSSLARPEHGHALIDAAVKAVSDDYRAFLDT